MIPVVRIILLALTIVLTFFGILLEEKDVLFVAILLLLTHNVLYGLEKFRERIVFTLFHATFFIFLMGRMVTVYFFNYKVYERGLFGTNFYSSEVIIQVFTMLLIALIGIFIGHLITEKVKTPTLVFHESNNWSLKTSITITLYLSFIFRMIYWLEAVIAAQKLGYFNYFANFETNLPKPIELFGEMFPVAFFMYLATMPKKEKLYLPIFLYVFEGAFAMMTGSRQAFMLNILIIVIYIIIRQIVSKKKIIISLITALPVIIILLNLVEQMRNQYATATSSIWTSALEFFYAQGVSVNVLGYTETLEQEIPDKIYIIGPLLEFFMFNMVGPFTGWYEELKGQTVERAIDGYQYSHTISYLIMPDLYQRGVGYGSSFIAEWYHDFGFVGILFGSVCIGALLVIFTRMLASKYVLVIAIALLMIRMTLFIPRASTIAFIIDTFSPVNILGVLFIYTLSLVLKNFERLKYRRLVGENI